MEGGVYTVSTLTLDYTYALLLHKPPLLLINDALKENHTNPSFFVD